MKRVRYVDDINEADEFVDFITKNQRLYGKPTRGIHTPEVYQTNYIFDGVTLGPLLASGSDDIVHSLPHFTKLNGAQLTVLSISIKGYVLAFNPYGTLFFKTAPTRKIMEFARMGIGFASDPKVLDHSTVYQGCFGPRNPNYTDRYKMLMDRQFILPFTGGGNVFYFKELWGYDNHEDLHMASTTTTTGTNVVAGSNYPSVVNGFGYTENPGTTYHMDGTIGSRLTYMPIFQPFPWPNNLSLYVDEYYTCNNVCYVDENGLCSDGDTPFIYFITHTKDLTPIGGTAPMSNESDVCFLGSVCIRYTTE